MKWLLFFIFSISLAGCETFLPDRDPSVAELDNVNSSVSGIMKAFDRSTPGGGIRARSTNGREFLSKYHPPKGDVYANATTQKVRAYSKLSILGDRRPYKLRVQYIVEERDESGRYQIVEKDSAKAQKILDDIKTFLVTRPDRDNFIDDFRPF